MDLSRSESPVGPISKRAKLDKVAETRDNAENGLDEELDGDHCSICLQLLLDRTVIPECSHEFCFECIVTWTEQSRRCPLCTRTIGPYLIHHIRSNLDYQKYHLPPLRSSPPSIEPLRRVRGASVRQRTARERRWGRRERREQDVVDELERAIDRRRWIYQNHLFAKHVGSNRASRYRPFPTPAQFTASPDYISRATIFIRRELRVWPNLDVEFLTTFILSLMKAIDIRSESAVKLLAEFLDMDCPYREGGRFPNAEHFAHVSCFQNILTEEVCFTELYSFLRSPYKSLSAYDVNVQYDEPEGPYRCSDRVEIAPENRTTNELTARTRERCHNRRRVNADDGSSRSRSKSNTRRSSDRLAENSLGSPEYDEAMQSTSFPQISLAPSSRHDSTPASLAAEGGTQGLDVNTDSNADLHKGKMGGRATPERLTTHTHGHGYDNKCSSRKDTNEDISLSSGNASVIAEKHVSAVKESNASESSSSYQNPSQPSGVHLRIRNPLLIARAHLSEGRYGEKLDNPRLPRATAEGGASELQKTSHTTNGQPPLLSRISEPEAQDNGSSADKPEGDPEASMQRGKSEKSVNLELRTTLLRRLEAERVAQAERARIGSQSENDRELQDVSSSPLSDSLASAGGGPSPPDGEYQTADLEAKARARARVRMKLAVAKHVIASNPRSGNDIIRDSEEREKPRTRLNREEILRTVLESRRRGG